jgi:hypothetical protein
MPFEQLARLHSVPGTHDALPPMSASGGDVPFFQQASWAQ